MEISQIATSAVDLPLWEGFVFGDGDWDGTLSAHAKLKVEEVHLSPNVFNTRCEVPARNTHAEFFVEINFRGKECERPIELWIKKRLAFDAIGVFETTRNLARRKQMLPFPIAKRSVKTCLEVNDAELLSLLGFIIEKKGASGIRKRALRKPTVERHAVFTSIEHRALYFVEILPIVTLRVRLVEEMKPLALEPHASKTILAVETFNAVLATLTLLNNPTETAIVRVDSNHVAIAMR